MQTGLKSKPQNFKNIRPFSKKFGTQQYVCNKMIIKDPIRKGVATLPCEIMYRLLNANIHVRVYSNSD